jgi:hypothetical protein
MLQHLKNRSKIPNYGCNTLKSWSSPLPHLAYRRRSRTCRQVASLARCRNIWPPLARCLFLLRATPTPHCSHSHTGEPLPQQLLRLQRPPCTPPLQPRRRSSGGGRPTPDRASEEELHNASASHASAARACTLRTSTAAT